MGSVIECPFSHAAEKIDVFFYRTSSERAVSASLCDSTTCCADFVTRLAINIGFPIPDQSHCKIIQLLEIVRRIKFVFSPVKPEPVDIPFHRADVLHVLGFGISIVKAKVTPTFVFRRKGEIETNRLGGSNMRVAVRLRGEARDDVATDATFLQIIIDDLLNKVPTFSGSRASAGIVGAQGLAV